MPPPVAPVRVAHIGSFGFDTQAFDVLAGKVVAAERDFWRDTRAAPVLITMISLGRDAHVINYNGTGRGGDIAECGGCVPALTQHRGCRVQDPLPGPGGFRLRRVLRG